MLLDIRLQLHKQTKQQGESTQVQTLARDSPCCPCCFFASMLTGQHAVGDSMEQLLLGGADEDRLLQRGREFQQCMCTHVYVI